MIYTYVSLKREAGPEQKPDPAQAAEFYATLGETITVWQCVEAGLFHIFETLVNARAPRSPLSAAYHQVPGFRARLDMTNAAASKALTDKQASAAWSGIYSVAVARSKRRNAMAHSVLFFEPAVRSPSRRLYLHPPLADKLRASIPKRQGDRITVKELREMRAGFADLHSALRDFHFDVLLAPEPP